jgi:ubiquinone/menaquinone biosynthesis C-methylase UbiE
MEHQMTNKIFDQAKLDTFTERVFRDLSGTYISAMCILGDRLGLFKALADLGPATSAEVAARANVQERYAREWLSAMTCAAYVEYDPANQRFRLPPEHAAVLAEEGGPHFIAGEYEQLPALLGVLDLLTTAFRQGGGVPQTAYHESLYTGLDRNSVVLYRHVLVQEWLPRMPEIQAALERGIDVADVGCGGGRALIALAQAFPHSRFTGYDLHAPTIALARQNAEAAGVVDRVRFVLLDAADGLPESYDLITTFIVVHDAANPRRLLRSIRAALKPEGTYLCVEVKASQKLEKNIGPMGAYCYSTSVLYCLTTSLAEGGEGLGTAGMPVSKVQELCTEAGFSSVRRLPIDLPFRQVFAITP